jgi:AcrR family transcriptional regulator
MFKSPREARAPTERGDATRDHILAVALRLFRKRGFDRTTMREVARSAKISLGAAYYYFPSKEALVHAFYAEAQRAHRERVEALCARSTSLVERVRGALETKVDVVNEDRALLGALFRYVGDADHPLSVFGEATAAQRGAAIAVFELALEGADPALPPPLRPAAARALWLVHLGLLLYWIHDPSTDQRRTRRLIARTAELVTTISRLAAVPGAASVLAPLLDVLEEASSIGLSTTPRKEST